jgi:glycosyltransferase involved in cell wall biosynthesis
MKLRLLVVQPYLTKYRVPVFSELLDEYEVVVAACRDPSYSSIGLDQLSGLGFEQLNERLFFSGQLIWQSGLVRLLFLFHPEVILLSANPRYLSTWICLVVSKISGCKVILHGQGRYNKKSLSLLNRTQYFMFALLSERYVCYTESCRVSLSDLRIYKKAVVAENSIVNDQPLKKVSVSDNGILFIGRLRESCNLDLLVSAVKQINGSGGSVQLHLVGGGDKQFSDRYNDLPYIHFYGELYDQKEITRISKSCFAGCYPGDAGLSVLHYMSLSLPPIVHSDLAQQMGPEPSYIVNGVNGLLFKRHSVESLVSSINKLMGDRALLNRIQLSAYLQYEALTTPSLGQRLLKIIKDVVGGGREST